MSDRGTPDQTPECLKEPNPEKESEVTDPVSQLLATKQSTQRSVNTAKASPKKRKKNIASLKQYINTNPKPARKPEVPKATVTKIVARSTKKKAQIEELN